MIERIQDIDDNHALDTDSYKLSHWNQYPPGTEYMMSYFESRGGEFEECTLFGLQGMLHERLSKPVTQEQVLAASDFAKAHGEPFNLDGWMHIVNEHDGKLPVRIRAIPEGTVVPTGNAIMTIESTDPNVFWIVSWLETSLVRLWEPSTVATTSRESKKIIKRYLDKTADDPDAEILFKLHDFGSRGVTSREQARVAGAAHLLNFLGSDTIEGIRYANHYYHCDMAGFSIPASEHSTVTMWGRENEYLMFEAYVKHYLIDRQVPEGLPKLAACVSDSFNIFEACKAWTGERLLPLIKESGGILVIRPDSGDPLVVLPFILDILEEQLKSEIITNSKGYKVLPPYLRLIQGDGINIESMAEILMKITSKGWSASNIAFGSGGGLLQRWDRDTQKWAFKCCAAKVDGEMVSVRKDPVTDPGKQSKEGRLDLIKTDKGYETVVLQSSFQQHKDSVMNVVFENGEILYDTTFDECRERMAL